MISQPSAATLEDVARLSGVSRSTVSRALRGQPGVAPEVRERVALIAESLDYRPNRAAQRLAGARMSLIALVMGSADLGGNLYAANLVTAISTAAAARKHGVMLSLSRRENAGSFDDLLRDRIVDGVVIRAFAAAEEGIERVLDSTVPSVLIGRHPSRDDVHSVDTEHTESSAILVGQLIDSGCSRIGMITGPDGRSDAMDRLAGYHLAHERRGLRVDESLVLQGNYQYEPGYDAGKRLIERQIDGIFAANDLSGLGAMDALQEAGVSVPDEVSVVGFDGMVNIGFSRFELTTMAQPFDRLADLALDTLLSLIDGKPVPLTQSVEPILRSGTTSRGMNEFQSDSTF